MQKNHEKAKLDLQRLLKTQNFNNIEEMQAFMNKHVVGQKIPEFDNEALTLEEQAQDLIYKAAQEDNPIAADRLIFQALHIDTDCVEAFELMGELVGSPMRSLYFYNNGVIAARKKLGKKFFKENVGHFWGIHETRPFMRCLKNYAECLYMLDQKEEALTVFFELLELNPNDNQGIRDQASLYCIELGRHDRFEKLQKEYNQDSTAFHYFNGALYTFIKNGDNNASRTELAKAREQNKHVLQLMLSKKELSVLADHYGIGDKNEALFYCTVAKDVWHSIPGALAWLENVYNKR